MKTHLTLLLITLVMPIATNVLATSSIPLPKSVVIVTSDKRPVSNTQNIASQFRRYGKTYDIHNLDDVTRLEQTWSEGLPAKEPDARIVFERRLNAKGRHNFEKELRDAYAGLFIALRHDINRYPVIIFDGEYAVYGVLDMEKALRIYNEYYVKKGGANE